LFFSQDSNLVPADTNGWQDAFLRDLAAAQTVALSANTNGAFSPMRSARHGLLTPDGRFAVLGIVNHASPFDMEGSSGSILWQNLETGERVVLASNLPPITAAFESGFASFAFSMSADGQRVAYPLNGRIVLADVATGLQTNVTGTSTTWIDPVLSADGRYVTHVNTSSREFSITDLQTP
jgi:Tol biopolymer transport system component